MSLATLIFGCTGLSNEVHQQPTEVDEIVDNLRQAGFPAEDIMVVDGVVYVGRDAQVSLAASREMLQGPDTRKEQYHTANLVSRSLSKICVAGSAFTGKLSTALDLAIQNYNEQHLTFAMARTPSTGCSFTIVGVVESLPSGTESGFPSGGRPFGKITISSTLSTLNVNTIAHIITHQLGHTIGLRHSDFFNQSISCGGPPVGEAPGTVGAILVSGTPAGATVGGSVMNTCTRQVETGKFSATDVTALKALYKLPTTDILLQRPNQGLVSLWLLSDGSIADRNDLVGPGAQAVATGDINRDGTTDIVFQHTDMNGLVGLWLMSNGTNADPHNLVGPGSVVVGTGDFNGDGISDILFQQPNEGLVGVWLMTADGNFADPHNLFVPGARVVGTGEFNGDGTTDIVFQHTDSNQLVAIWLMSNGGVMDTITLVGPGAPVVGTGDFNGDGQIDILFQHANQGMVAVWLMTGGGRFADPHDLFVPGAAVVGTGDFNGDGTTDVLFQHTDTGQVAEWLMSNGVPRTQELEVPPGGARVVGTGNFDGR
jgi:hypothetical protein